MTSVVLRSDGTTTCCNVPYVDDEEGNERCSNCHRPVQVRIVKEGTTLTMVAGAQPCISFNYRPKKRKRPQPRKARTTARRGRGKSSKR